MPWKPHNIIRKSVEQKEKWAKEVEEKWRKNKNNEKSNKENSRQEKWKGREGKGVIIYLFSALTFLQHCEQVYMLSPSRVSLIVTSSSDSWQTNFKLTNFTITKHKYPRNKLLQLCNYVFFPSIYCRESLIQTSKVVTRQSTLE